MSGVCARKLLAAVEIRKRGLKQVDSSLFCLQSIRVLSFSTYFVLQF